MSGPTPRTLDLVWARAEGCCERCGLGLIRRAGGYGVHHRRLKGMGGDRRPDTHLAANLVLLCDSCHADVHVLGSCLLDLNHGFIVSRWADPEMVGVKTALRGWSLHDNGGGRQTWQPA